MNNNTLEKKEHIKHIPVKMLDIKSIYDITMANLSAPMPTMICIAINTPPVSGTLHRMVRKELDD